MSEPQLFKGGFTAEQLQKIASDAVTKAQQSTSGPLIAHPIEFLAEDGATRLDVSNYRYQPFPKMMYSSGGRQRIVHSQEEMAKLGKEWSSTPKARPSWDVRKQDAGYVLTDHHLAFFNSPELDFGFENLAEATAYFKDLAEEAQIDFLRDAEEWIAPLRTAPPDEEEDDTQPTAQRRGPGRPKKSEAN